MMVKMLETDIKEIQANKIFENAFESRFEFPEVLNDDGSYKNEKISLLTPIFECA